ncbi:acetyl-coenzyme A synthetase [Isoalcanivorax pacificus W11-5]|uniref:Acetyl-coenzyme A synthetase n=1 Tax=Isoalcanivorax pacificus W11-5 TaxID=391936 RepID=A0A0B4XRW6_9GAMM|nr:acetate--CoA ligase [Isoalcanivorax pacificus]AJD49500.1 acetyl-coenzyme A synthetase [Isoalcanivorax pacificus W11-5]
MSATHATVAPSDIQPVAVKPRFRDNAWMDATTYDALYARSIDGPDTFWREQSQRLHWRQPPTQIRDIRWDKNDLHIRWFADGQLNAAENCIDRHLSAHADRVALYWEPDTPGEARVITYAALHQQVCKLANVLKHLGVRKGDRVTIYLPMIPEAVFAMLACARIGAIHSVVFGGFSPEAVAGRIADCGSSLVITADAGLRGGREIPLKANVDAALARPEAKAASKVLVVQHTGGAVDWHDGRDLWYHDLMATASEQCEPAVMNAEDPLFILYTSGSTGKPKGVLHTTGGYLTYASLTHQMVFDYHPGDIYWCTADVGWITGHTYLVYGPLANGATCVMSEGLPNWPDAARLGQIIDKFKVNTLYTAPTAIRALMAAGDGPLAQSRRDSLKLLATAGEPINPAAWHWFHDSVGHGGSAVVDTWWQTETGGVMITPLPGAHATKPGAAMRPFFGIRPALVDNDGTLIDGPGEGNLVILDSWPAQARTLWGDHQRFIDTYFTTFPGTYCSGDGARRDADGDYWITGRVDDVINVSGHRMGTAEIESALVSHPAVAEAAVVGYPHEIKGQGIYVYVSLTCDHSPSDELYAELRQWVRREIGAIATPDLIHWAPGLPKTRSGKIMRRILRKIAANEHDSLGDVSTLAEPAVVPQLVETRMNR